MSDLWADWAEGHMGIREEGIRAVAAVLSDLEVDETDGMEILIRMLAYIAAESGQGVAMMMWLGEQIQEAEEALERDERVLQ